MTAPKSVPQGEAENLTTQGESLAKTTNTLTDSSNETISDALQSQKIPNVHSFIQQYIVQDRVYNLVFELTITELDSENYGAPPENSSIPAYSYGMQSPKASYTEPQAWEDEYGNWFYNFPGALQLAKALGRTLPDLNQLRMAIDTNPDNFRQNAGSRHDVGGKISGRGRFSDFWSSDDVDSDRAYNVYLGSGMTSSDWNKTHRLAGLSVRFIVDKK